MNKPWKNHKMKACPKCGLKLYVNGYYESLKTRSLVKIYQCNNALCEVKTLTDAKLQWYTSQAIMDEASEIIG